MGMGNTYGKLTQDATPALAYLAHARAESVEKVTLTHFVGKAVAEAQPKEEPRPA